MKIRKLRWYWPSALVVLVIIYATWLPQPLPDSDMPSIPHIDKLIHAVMMGGLAAALMFDYYRSSPHRRLTFRHIVRFTLIAAAFSVIDEFVQGILPIGRPSDTLDLLADWLGCIIAALTAPPAIRAVVKRRKSEPGSARHG